jgi:hypothetical protein
MKMEAILSSEMSVHTRFTRRHSPEYGILYRQILLAYLFFLGYYITTPASFLYGVRWIDKLETILKEAIVD